MVELGPLAELAESNVSLKPYVMLRAGGPAEWLAKARNLDQLAHLAERAQRAAIPTTILGWGSNVLPSDQGVEGLVILNLASRIELMENGEVLAECGCGFQELFLKTAQAGLRGLEFAVGIPGTLGGALVSNAGAYRSDVSEFLTRLEVVFKGKRQWVEPGWMQFSYRDSRLRHPDTLPCVLLRVRLKLPRGDRRQIYKEAREYQRQRIAKQPPQASAGSFFKNVIHHELAQKLPGLSEGMRSNGVIPTGFLIEAVGLKGFRMGGAMFSPRHANILVNLASASATEIRDLAQLAKQKVRDKFQVLLEEEVLYLGRWN